MQKKYEPQKTQLQALQSEIDSLTKQLQSAPATMTEDERASRQRTIERKQKQYQRDGEDATNAFNAEMQDTLGTVAKKLGPIVIKYVQDNGYTMLLDNTGQPAAGRSFGALDTAWYDGYLAGCGGRVQRVFRSCGAYRRAIGAFGVSSASRGATAHPSIAAARNGCNMAQRRTSDVGLITRRKCCLTELLSAKFLQTEFRKDICTVLTD